MAEFITKEVATVADYDKCVARTVFASIPPPPEGSGNMGATFS